MVNGIIKTNFGNTERKNRILNIMINVMKIYVLLFLLSGKNAFGLSFPINSKNHKYFILKKKKKMHPLLLQYIILKKTEMIDSCEEYNPYRMLRNTLFFI